MRWLNLAEVLELHRNLIQQSGGSSGIRDLGLLEAAHAQPLQTFVDGNKRIGHAAMEVAMIPNGLELSTNVDDAEAVVQGVATGLIDRDALMHWLEEHQIPSIAG